MVVRLVRFGGVLALVSWVGIALAGQPTKRPTDLERGKELYLRHCASCHGPKAAGDGPATEALVAKVPDLSAGVKTDKATIDLVVFGRSAMPGFEASFDAEDAKRTLMYLNQLDNPAPTAPAPAPAAVPEPTEGDAQGG